MTIDIYNEAGARVSLRRLRDTAEFGLRTLKYQTPISVALVLPRTIRKLNKQYRGRDKVTDVLSFTLDTDDTHPAMAGTVRGEVVICYEVAKKQAQDDHKSIRSVLDHLLIHGILHIAGYDHETDVEAEEMEAYEERILHTLARKRSEHK